MAGFRIAVTGTPGVGKTTFCAASKWSNLTVQDLAETHDCIDDVDADGAAPIDIEKLGVELVWPDSDCLLVDGHLSHLLPVDAVILIRCHPSVLRERLNSRNYSDSKIEENVECELIGVISADCLDLPCLELDSEIGIEAMIHSAEGWVTDGFKPHRPNEGVDWIAQIHGEG